MMSSPQSAFERLISHEPSKANFNDLQKLATALWYEEFTPDVANVAGYEAQVTCYLLERLIRFNCVSDTRYDKLDGIIERIKRDLTIVPSNDPNISKFAKRWGLNSDMSVLFHELLPFQKRHYQNKL